MELFWELCMQIELTESNIIIQKNYNYFKDKLLNEIPLNINQILINSFKYFIYLIKSLYNCKCSSIKFI